MKILIREVMTYGFETISPAATIEEAAKRMRTHNIGMLPVLDGETLTGVVTDRDLAIRAVAERLRPEMTRVREVMTKKPISCYEDDDILKASLIMEKNLVHRLVVIDRNERIVGIVSLSDIAAKTYNDALSGHVLGQVSVA